MDMIKTSIEDGPVSHLMLGKGVIDDGGKEGAEHLGFEGIEVFIHGRTGVDLVFIIF